MNSRKVPNISVVINCYNGEKYLKSCIDSVYQQTYSDWQIIFIDNQSTDNSAQIAKSYDEKLVYFKTPHFMSLYEGRNYALNLIKTKYVAFIDTDDMWHPSKLELQVPLLAKADIVYCGYRYIDGSGDACKQQPQFTKYRGSNLTSKLLKTNFISVCSVLGASEIFKDHLFNNRFNLIGDFELWVRLSTQYRFDFVDQDLELCRQHPNNLSKESKKNWFLERSLFCRLFLKNFGYFKYPAIYVYAARNIINAIRGALNNKV